MSVPPSIALMAAVVQGLLGNSLAAARFLPALAGAGTVFFTGAIVREMGGGRFAQMTACAAVLLSPAFLRSNWLFQPVAFNQFYWVVLAYLVVRYIGVERPQTFLWIGVVAGLAMLNKYSVLLFLAGIFAGLMATPHRKVFLTRYPYLAAAIALLIFLPNLIWQAGKGFPLIGHMSELSRTQLVNVEPVGFLLDQLLFHLPALLVWVTGLLFLFFAEAGKPFRVLGWNYVTIILALLLLSGKGYYSMGAYPMLMAAGGVFLERLSSSANRWLRPAVPALMVSLLLPVLPLSLPILSINSLVSYCDFLSEKVGISSPMRWEDGRIYPLPQDHADMLGWEELTDIVAGTWRSLAPDEKVECMIYAENYGQAGAIDHLGEAYGLPSPVSFQASYFYWSPDEFDYRILIYVNREPEEVEQLFNDVREVSRITDEYAREYGLPVYLCKNPKMDLNQLWSDIKRREGMERGYLR